MNEWFICVFFFSDAGNRENFKAIENAIFLLCLDQPPPHSAQAASTMEDPTASVTARQCLHGDGTQSNSCNRWFDKIIQVRHRFSQSYPFLFKTFRRGEIKGGGMDNFCNYTFQSIADFSLSFLHF